MLAEVERTAVGDETSLISFAVRNDTTSQVDKPGDLSFQTVPLSRLGYNLGLRKLYNPSRISPTENTLFARNL